jgi:hypothetical protein
VFEHALHSAPRLEHGYCTDDVARALVVVLHEPQRSSAFRRLEEICLTFLENAQLDDGRFRNRLSPPPERRWLDEVGSDDSNGRALWALGTTAAHGSSVTLRQRALARFAAGAAAFRSPSPRTNAYATLGAVEVLCAWPHEGVAKSLLMVAASRLGELRNDPVWPWPEARLTYDNARLAQARVAAGVALEDRQLLDEGLRLLRWLVEIETHSDHFSFTPQTGWARGEPRPAFDQQPIEAGAMADACATAFDATGDDAWIHACLRAAVWFVGANDTGVLLLDPVTGGCSDGLEARGCNRNQGAESTLAMISALQQARRLQAAARRAARSSAVSTLAAPTQRSAAP